MSALVQRDGPGFIAGSLTAFLIFGGILLLTVALS
jgi:hypothetical protein